jgi:multidrug resistance efflux pump
MKLSAKLLGRVALPVIALGLIGFAVATLTPKDTASAVPPATPATAPDSAGAVVAALGVVEPSSEIIAVASELPGVVREVFVKSGDLVAAGAPLFRLDGRALSASLEAQMASAQQARANSAASASRVPSLQANAATAAAGIAQAEAALLTAQGQVTQALGRLATSRSAAEVARLTFNDAQARFALFQNISDPRAISTDERDRARFAMERAKAAYDQAQASVQEAEGGVAVAQGGVADARSRIASATSSTKSAQASVIEGQEAAKAAQAGSAQATAQARVVSTDLERLIVRAPIAGQILRINVRLGEFASAGPLTSPLVSMGAVDPLHVRVQIDEEDAARISAGAPAQATLRGDAAKRIPLTFVRFEPQAIPKTNLNGGAERIDTRVVEAIYAFDRKSYAAFVGQQMDVFVTARPLMASAQAQIKAPAQSSASGVTK